MLARPCFLWSPLHVVLMSAASPFHTLPFQARRFAQAMKAPLIFCSSSHAINIHKIFKVVLSKVFDIPCKVQQERMAHRDGDGDGDGDGNDVHVEVDVDGDVDGGMRMRMRMGMWADAYM